jgi:hypothetical protein
MKNPQTTSPENTNYKLDDSTIAGLMQLLTLAIVTGTNLMDHLRLMELVPNEHNQLQMTDDFIARTESLAADLMEKMDDMQDGDEVEMLNFG